MLPQVDGSEGGGGKKRKKEKIHCKLKRLAGGVEDTVHKNAVKGLPNRWAGGRWAWKII